MTNSIGEIPGAEVLLVIGANPTEAHPIIGLKIKEAVRNGAALIVADPRKIWLTKIARIHLPIRPGTDLALVNGMANVIFSEGLSNAEFVKARTEGIEEFVEVIERWPVERAAEMCEVPGGGYPRGRATLCSRGPRSHFLHPRHHRAYLRHLQRSGPGQSVPAHRPDWQGEQRGESASRPEQCPGRLRHGRAARRLFGISESCHRRKPPQVRAGMEREAPRQTGNDDYRHARGRISRALKAMYVMGEDPVMSEAHASFVREALQGLDLLVVQDIFMNETAKLADVVLPAFCFAEKDGTFTNTERRVQRVRKAVDPPAQAREDWRIVADISSRMGYDMDYNFAITSLGRDGELVADLCGDRLFPNR